MKYILGLDLGPTSIGWAAVELDNNGNPKGLASIADRHEDTIITHHALGARIFPEGIDNINQGQKETPRNKKRRENRSKRRRLRRAKARRNNLIKLLCSRQIIPSDISDLKNFLEDNLIPSEEKSYYPYKLRVKALDEKIELHEFGRILLHMSKRRGFKSNRKQQAKDTDAGKIKQAIKNLKSDLQQKTIGQFWAEKIAENPLDPIRNRKGDYRWIAQRSDYKDELAMIWAKQAQYYPEILSKELYEILNKILFEQLPFELSQRKKTKVLGMCTLIPGQIRLSMSNRKAQEYRLLQKINDLRVDIDGDFRPLEDQERTKLITELSISKEKNFKQIRKLLGWPETAKINLEHETNDKIKGNEIDYQLANKKIFGKDIWLNLADEAKNQVWSHIQKFLSEDSTNALDFAKSLEKDFSLKIHNIEALDSINEPIGTISFCQKAVDKILPYMREGLGLDKAIDKAGFAKKWHKRELLAVPNASNGWDCRNPVVSTVLYQLRQVSNLLIKELGKPEKIIIEFARELKGNNEKRQEIIKKQKSNQTDNEKAEKAVRELMGRSDDYAVSGTDLMKYKLWKEQGLYCPYTCKTISETELFSRETEIDHILPYSMSLDNSYDNKVVCFANANQSKGQNTPISWLGENSSSWSKIATAAAKGTFKFSDSKWERFQVHNSKIAESYTPERLLNETSYIARLVKSYMESLYDSDLAHKKVLTTKGGITAQLRNIWDINPILRDGEIGPKNRDDLRHHAIDAAVIAVTSPSMIQRITKQLQDAYPKRPSQVANITEPWKGFADDLAHAVDKINISHRVQRKVKGALHKETNYCLETNGEHAGKYITRKAVQALTPAMVDCICDKNVKKLLQSRIAEYDGDIKKAFEYPIYLPNKNNPAQPIPIKSVRIWTSSNTMVQISDNAWVEPGSNHHVEIF